MPSSKISQCFQVTRSYIIRTRLSTHTLSIFLRIHLRQSDWHQTTFYTFGWNLGRLLFLLRLIWLGLRRSFSFRPLGLWLSALWEKLRNRNLAWCNIKLKRCDTKVISHNTLTLFFFGRSDLITHIAHMPPPINVFFLHFLQICGSVSFTSNGCGRRQITFTGPAWSFSCACFS